MKTLQIKSGGGRAVRAYRFKADAVDAEKGTFTGYGSVFNTDPDAYGEIVAPGAFTESLKEHRAEGTRPALLWQHNPAEPIGVYTEVKEDTRGLYVEGKLALETQRGAEARELLAMGALDGLSIGFMPRKHEVDDETGIVTLTEIDLWEVSLVTFPANEAARVVDVRNAEFATIREIEHAMRDAGMPVALSKKLIADIREIAVRDERERVAREAVHSALIQARQAMET